jgi:hypothetical protein
MELTVGTGDQRDGLTVKRRSGSVSVCRVTRWRQRKVNGKWQQPQAEIVYLITSLTACEASPKALLQINRDHWSVEIMHRDKDVTLGVTWQGVIPRTKPSWACWRPLRFRPRRKAAFMPRLPQSSETTIRPRIDHSLWSCPSLPRGSGICCKITFNCNAGASSNQEVSANQNIHASSNSSGVEQIALLLLEARYRKWRSTPADL